MLPDRAWGGPSWCAGRTVKDTVAHMISTSTLTPPTFFAKLIGSGFSFGRMTTAADPADRLEATDTSWTHGDRPTVRGPILDLVLAMTGRRQVIGGLAGDGVRTLRSRP